jgi:hypothetical protein
MIIWADCSLTGIGNGMQMYYLGAAALGVLFVGTERIALASVMGLVAVLLIIALELFVPRSTGLQSDTAMFYNFVGTAIGCTGTLLAIVFYALREAARAEAVAQHEHERSESLLANILPATIAERLKSNPHRIADAVLQGPAHRRRARRRRGLPAYAEGTMIMKRRTTGIGLVVLLLAVVTSRVEAQVGVDRLLNAAKEARNWLMYSGGYFSNRYSTLTQITPANAKNLELKWMYQAAVAGAWQTTPLVVDGIMYLTQRPNDVVALDAKTGRVFWMYRHTLDPTQIVCCGANNRGLAILGDTLFMGTLDAHLVAIDA